MTNQYRLLWSSLGRSKKIKNIEGPKGFRIMCHLIYTWLIPWADDDGRLLGEILWLLVNIFPNEDFTEKELEKSLVELTRVKLIFWYIVNDEQFIQIIDWSSHQRIRKDRYKPSRYPEWQPSVNQVSTKCQPSVNLSPTPTPTPTQSPPPKNTADNFKNLFNKFWTAYPKKKSKTPALKAFLKIKPSEQLLETMISTIERAKTSEGWRKEGGQYIPYPATWLNDERWEDEDEPAKPKYAT